MIKWWKLWTYDNGEYDEHDENENYEHGQKWTVSYLF